MTREGKSCQSCSGTSNQMYSCDRCYLATYCSPRCSQRDWTNHKEDCKFVTWHRKHVGRNFCHFCFAHSCDQLGHSQLKRCGGCLRVSYCSQKCQKDDWLAHVAICPGNKNRKSIETLRTESIFSEIQAEHEQEMADRLAVIRADAEERRLKRARRRAQGLESDEDSADESPVSREQRLKLEIQNRCAQELAERMTQEGRPWADGGQDGGKVSEEWEKKWKQSKTILGAVGKGGSHSPAVQQTKYRIRISNKPPVSHDSFVRNADNTMSYEQEVREVQPDGSIVYRKHITRGVFENDAQAQQLHDDVWNLLNNDAREDSDDDGHGQ